MLVSDTRRLCWASLDDTAILEEKGTEVLTIAPEASVKRAADWLRAKNVGVLVVTSNDAILGIISERDIVRAFSQYGEPVASMQVKDIMTHSVITASLGDDLTHLMRLMTRRAPLRQQVADLQTNWDGAKIRATLPRDTISLEPSLGCRSSC